MRDDLDERALDAADLADVRRREEQDARRERLRAATDPRQLWLPYRREPQRAAEG